MSEKLQGLVLLLPAVGGQDAVDVLLDGIVCARVPCGYILSLARWTCPNNARHVRHSLWVPDGNGKFYHPYCFLSNTSYTGDISHWKGSEKGTAQHGAGMQCHRIPVRVSLVNADPVLLARPHSIPLLYHFHRSTADSQRRFQAARKRPCLQHNGSCVSADVEAASAFYYTVRAADRSGLSILFEAVTPHPAAAPYWLGCQSACLWYFIADLRTRLTVMQPDN